MTKNKRLDDHFSLGDSYLIQAVTDAVGNYFATSLDKSALGVIKGTVTADGNYSVEMIDSEGTHNVSASGGLKVKAKDKTETVAGHNDSGTGGGQRSTVQKGVQSENNGAETAAVNGPSAKTTAQSAKTFAQGGNGKNVVQGDYTLSAKEGGIHLDADKEITVTAKGKNIGLGTKTGTITLTAGSNKIIIGPLGISIVADVGPVLIYSRAGDVHIAGEKFVSVQSYTKDITVTTPAGRIDLNP